VKKKEEKKTDVVFCIEKGAFAEQEAHPFHRVLPLFKRKALVSLSSDKQYIKPHFHQRIANPVHTLVSGKIIGYRDDYTFQSL
jgi:hypothetical protein